MNYLLFIIIILLVIAIGIILTSPFLRPDKQQETPHAIPDDQQRYYKLLREIKLLEQESGFVDNPEDIHQEIEDKKAQAANLLRQMHPHDRVASQKHTPIEQPEETPEAAISSTRGIETVCPKCGGRVIPTDKFCTHCGFRMKP